MVLKKDPWSLKKVLKQVLNSGNTHPMKMYPVGIKKKLKNRQLLSFFSRLQKFTKVSYRWHLLLCRKCHKNCPLRLNFANTHQMKKYLNTLKIEKIDATVQCTKLHITDIISNNLFSFFSRKYGLQKLHIDVADFYVNY